ncbi:hypothetical protein L1887_63373 [Cichorium endivia]|nr:hypothetical protein L1887_63373 [Cichorium endivia]
MRVVCDAERTEAASGSQPRPQSHIFAKERAARLFLLAREEERQLRAQRETARERVTDAPKHRRLAKSTTSNNNTSTSSPIAEAHRPRRGPAAKIDAAKIELAA